MQCQDGSAVTVGLGFGSGAQLLPRRNGSDEHLATTLSRGDVLVLQGLTQQFFEHCVPAQSKSILELPAASSTGGFLKHN